MLTCFTTGPVYTHTVQSPFLSIKLTRILVKDYNNLHNCYIQQELLRVRNMYFSAASTSFVNITLNVCALVTRVFS